MTRSASLSEHRLKRQPGNQLTFNDQLVDMAASKPGKFEGFPFDTLRFLGELSLNNNRDWFEENRQRYEDSVRTPALDFITAMEAPLHKISPHFKAVPKKVGGSLMRVYRDTRFSKDKTPYKTNVGIHFRHERGKDVHAPGIYLHIDTESTFLGMGIWHPDSKALAKIRKAIVKEPERWLKIKKAAGFKKSFQIQGDRLKRKPKDYPADHPMIEELKWKDHIAVCELDYDTIMSRQIMSELSKKMRAGSKYLEFLCQAMKLKF